MKKLWIIAITALALSSCERGISEFQTQNFVKYFGNELAANGFDVAELSDGYILTGFDNTSALKKQVFVVRTNKAGNVIWQHQYGTSANEEGRVVKQVGEDFYVLGTTTNDISGVVNSFLLKISSAGDSLSYLRIGPDGYSVIVNDFFVDASNIYVVGESYQNSTTFSDYFVAKYTLAGDQVWTPREYGPSGNSQSFKKVTINSDGTFNVVGTNNGIIGGTLTHVVFGKLSSTGYVERVDYLPATSNQNFADAVFIGNEILIVYNQLVSGNYNARVVKVSVVDYSTIWEVTTGLEVEGKAIDVSADGEITLGGDKSNAIHIYQLSSTGSVTLTSSKPLPGSVSALAATSDKGLVLVGTTVDYGELVQMVKTDAELFLFNP